MYCQKCGTFNEDSSVFCCSCGAKLGNTQEKTSADIGSDANSAAQQPISDQNAVKENTKMIKCPFCAEKIQAEAVICRYCHSRLDVKAPYQTQQSIPAPSYQSHSSYTTSSSVKQKVLTNSKLAVIVMNAIAFLGVFFPVFVIPAIKSAINGLSYMGIDSGLNANLSPISYFSFFKWVGVFNDLKSVGTLTPVICSYILFFLFEIISVSTFIMALKSDDAVNYSKKSIKFLMGINIVSIAAVSIFNLSLKSGNQILDYITKSLNMDFPVSALIFLIIDIVFLIVISKIKENSGYSGEKSQSTNNNTWVCENCYTINSSKNNICENCNKKRKAIVSNPMSTDWCCNKCGTYNSSKSTSCMNCGNKKGK